MTTGSTATAGAKGQVKSLRPGRKAYRDHLILALLAGGSVTLRMEREYDRPWYWDLRFGIAFAGVLAVLATVW